MATLMQKFAAHKFLDESLAKVDDFDLEFAEGKAILNSISNELLPTFKEETSEFVEAEQGFNYWKTKIEKLKTCKDALEVSKLLEEYMFTDNEDDRRRFNASKFKVVQIAMMIFINCARNKIWEFPR
jgi:hypothetical protein